jgi:Lactonase, 7-bladed beta-propeller/Tn3 transposase DDE domain
MSSLHLLQNCMVYINTLMMQQVLSRPHWAERLSTLAITFVATSSHAQFVYVANSGDGTVSGYTVDSNTGALAPINGSAFTSGSGPSSAPVSVAVDPSGKFAYVANFNSAPSIVSGFTIDQVSGALTPATNSPFPAGFAPVSVAVAVATPLFLSPRPPRSSKSAHGLRRASI